MKLWLKIMLFAGGLFLTGNTVVLAAGELNRDETFSFCLAELGKRIGAVEAAKMKHHCDCATDAVLAKTPESLKEPFSRLVRRQGLRPEDQAAFKAETGNFFLYLAMLDNQCPKILKDPQLQKLLLPVQ
ncbi:hypothetical protein O4H49_10085 [Kiloniella laminariae]|uniref:Rap1a immunity protein domain-containing protein n=1 Tax=Kiloniella laminariae TaxID=454162 RepID=A0ABT4LMD3_9PROT|nr:hypothetical protein [Kiloniella laminariae]MCZ4281127.1 hypothetical protein [Kiloniella laminariae]